LTATIIDGRTVAARVLESVRARVAVLHARDVRPALAFVLVGESAPARLYARRIERQAQPLGIELRPVQLPADLTREQLDQTVWDLSQDESVDGILVQMPLPERIGDADLSELIDPRKDVDGITIQNAGRLYLEMPGQFPSTALAMIELLDAYDVDPRGKDVVVVGRSKVVGHPLAELLIRRDATVTVAHRRTRDLGRHTRHADIVLVAAGQPNLITGDMLKPGVVVIDAGMNPTAEGVVGDVDFEAARQVACAVTPVPGGVGPVTNAVLLRNLVQSAEWRHA